jgi:hypothetical protein
MVNKPREKTEQEVRNEFLDYIRSLVDYCEQQSDRNLREKLELLAFSILVGIDGNAGGLPAFILAPYGHKEDKEYHISNGNNFYAENHNSDIKCDIAGSMHDEFYNPVK